MIEEAKRSPALVALRTVIVLARAMSYDKRPHAEIADVLDVAEYLPTLLLEDRDCTRQFRENLEQLARKYPEFQMAVERFDRPYPSE